MSSCDVTQVTMYGDGYTLPEPAVRLDVTGASNEIVANRHQKHR
jgi:hypothetical protein